MNLAYYFWSSKKKQGYSLGILEHPRYVTWFSGPEGKEINIEEYVTPIIDVALQSPRLITEKNVSELENRIKENNAKIENETTKYNSELNKALAPLIEKREEALKDKEGIKAEFSDLSVNVEQQLSDANKMLDELKKKLSEYCDKCKNYWENQGDQIKRSWNSIISREKKIAWEAIRDSIIGNDRSSDNTDSTQGKSYVKDMSNFFFFFLMCIYDVVFGYKAIDEYNFFEAKWKTLFVALFFVPILIGIVHVLTVGSDSKSSIMRLFCKISLLFVIGIVFLFVLISLGTDINNIFSSWSGFLDIVQRNGEVLFRATIIPAILAGEMLINVINWENVWEFFGRYFKWGRKLNIMLIKGLTVLKANKLSKWAKDEKVNVEKVIDDLKKQSLPDFQGLDSDITRIEGLLSPIYDKIGGRKAQYNKEMEDVNIRIKNCDSEIEKLKTTRKIAFDNEIAKLKSEIEKDSKNIEKCWSQFNNMKEEFKNGFVIGLGDNS